MVTANYFTKWIETEVLISMTPERIKEFMYKNIICHYWVPYTIVLDNEKLFDCEEFKEFYDNPQIKKVFSSMARSQVNGQVKVVNKIIKHKLKTKLEDLKGRWANKLLEVLWAYRTTARTLTGETPLSLAYGYEAMMPVEIRAGSLRRETYDSNQNVVLQK